MACAIPIHSMIQEHEIFQEKKSGMRASIIKAAKVPKTP